MTATSKWKNTIMKKMEKKKKEKNEKNTIMKKIEK